MKSCIKITIRSGTPQQTKKEKQYAFILGFDTILNLKLAHFLICWIRFTLPTYITLMRLQHRVAGGKTYYKCLFLRETVVSGRIWMNFTESLMHFSTYRKTQWEWTVRKSQFILLYLPCILSDFIWVGKDSSLSWSCTSMKNKLETTPCLRASFVLVCYKCAAGTAFCYSLNIYQAVA